MAEPLKTLTAEYILKNLSNDVVNQLLGQIWLPFLYRIEGVFDNISRGNKVDSKILSDFCKQFPQFCHFSKHQDRAIGMSEAYSAFYFHNEGIIDDQPAGLYAICTYRKLTPMVNNELLNFFHARSIPVWPGLSLRKPQDQYEPLCS